MMAGVVGGPEGHFGSLANRGAGGNVDFIRGARPAGAEMELRPLQHPLNLIRVMPARGTEGFHANSKHEARVFISGDPHDQPDSSFLS